MNDRLPWLLLVASWVYFSSPKSFYEKVLKVAEKQQKIPWILLLLSWSWFAFPLEFRKKITGLVQYFN
jgi:hypothetical protein